MSCCPFCGKIPDSFRDALSAKEHMITGLCQECQDETFCDLLAGKTSCNKPCHQDDEDAD